MSDAAVTLEGVWKKFRRGERHDSLRDLLPALARRILGRRRGAGTLEADEFWALSGVTFEVGPGEAVGVIGPNGAGKSTILKLLTKILRPTEGRVEVRGRVGALIEVAAGFHPDLTGRENVYLQGAILGMKQAEVARKFDEIVDFAGIGEFIDTPVKRYSSGMNARLGFAIAAHLDPDVLLVDEVLSVGDAGFQERCVARMRGLIRQGVPLVFVSHNLMAVLELCTRAVVLARGEVIFDGEPAKAIQAHRTVLAMRGGAGNGKGNGNGNGSGGDIRIAGVRLLDRRGGAADVVETGEPLTVAIEYEASRPVERPHFAVDILRADSVYCYGVSSAMDGQDFGTIEGRGRIELAIPRLALLPGCYTVSVGIHHANGSATHDLLLQAYPFSVRSARRELGLVALEHAWRHVDVRAGRRPSMARGKGERGP